MNLCFNCSLRTPSHSTVVIWVKKYGLFQMLRQQSKADDWVVIIDESVHFGQNKLLLVYGIRQSEVDFTRTLHFNDLTPMVLMSRASWTGECIKQQLEILEQRFGKIMYAVADQGNPIKKALKTKGIQHVYDITHCISLIVEHIYKEDTEFVGYTRKMAKLRGAQALGKMSHVLPPTQRVNARFMNLRPISDWGMAVLNLLENGPAYLSKEKHYLAWVSTYQRLIKELWLLNEMINKIQSILKSRGLSKETANSCAQILEKANTEKLKRFKNDLIRYFEDTFTGKGHKQISQLLCSSDIIESAFGKYKNYLQANSMVGITNLSLSLAAFTGQHTGEEIKDALQTVQINKVQSWTNENIGPTTLSKRKQVLKWNENSN